MNAPPALLPMPLDAATAARVAAIIADAFAAPNPGWDAPALIALSETPGVGVWVAMDGAILTRRVMDEAEVLTIAVRPPARGRGVGRALIDAALGVLAAAGTRRVFLEVAEDNAPARALYAAAGFRETGLRRGYYRDASGAPVDALLMERSLAPAAAQNH